MKIAHQPRIIGYCQSPSPKSSLKSLSFRILERNLHNHPILCLEQWGDQSLEFQPHQESWAQSNVHSKWQWSSQQTQPVNESIVNGIEGVSRHSKVSPPHTFLVGQTQYPCQGQWRMESEGQWSGWWQPCPGPRAWSQHPCCRRTPVTKVSTVCIFFLNPFFYPVYHLTNRLLTWSLISMMPALWPLSTEVGRLVTTGFHSLTIMSLLPVANTPTWDSWLLIGQYVVTGFTSCLRSKHRTPQASLKT